MPVGYTPIFRINQEGVDITDRFNDRLTEIEVKLESGRGSSDTCSITLDDRDWRISSPTVGRKLEIYLGYKEVGLAQQNVFEIKTVEYLGPPRSIKITGTSVGFIGALKAPAIKEFDNKSLKEIVEDIAKKAGVTAMVEQGLGETKVPFVNQSQSSIHLLGELERRYGAYAKFDNGKLVFLPRDSYASVSGLSTPTVLLRPEHVARWSVRHDKRGDYSGARAAYMDPKTNDPVWVEQKNPKAVTGEQGQDTRTPFRLSEVFKSEAEARAAMSDRISTLNRSMGELNVTLSKGDPWIRDNQLAMMSGFREGINGAYVSETVTHTYRKQDGLLITINGKPPGTFDDLPSAGSDREVTSAVPGVKLGSKPPVIERT